MAILSVAVHVHPAQWYLPQGLNMNDSELLKSLTPIADQTVREIIEFHPARIIKKEPLLERDGVFPVVDGYVVFSSDTVTVLDSVNRRSIARVVTKVERWEEALRTYSLFHSNRKSQVSDWLNRCIRFNSSCLISEATEALNELVEKYRIALTPDQSETGAFILIRRDSPLAPPPGPSRSSGAGLMTTSPKHSDESKNAMQMAPSYTLQVSAGLNSSSILALMPEISPKIQDLVLSTNWNRALKNAHISSCPPFSTREFESVTEVSNAFDSDSAPAASDSTSAGSARSPQSGIETPASENGSGPDPNYVYRRSLELKEENDSLRDRVAQLESSVTSLGERVKFIEGKNSRLEQFVHKSSRKLGEVLQAVESLLREMERFSSES